MKFKNTFVTFLAISVLTLSSASAQTSAGLKMGFINWDRLLQESPQSQEASAALEDEFAPRFRQIVALQTELEAKAAQLEKDAEVMGATELDNANRALRNDQRELVRAQNEFREDRDIRNNELLGAVQQEIALVVNDFGKTNGYDLILARGIVFVSEKVDVTQQILDRLAIKQ